MGKAVSAVAMFGNIGVAGNAVNKNVCLFDVRDKQRVSMLTDNGPVSALTLSASTLLSSGGNGLIRLWDLRMRKVCARLPAHKHSVIALALAPGCIVSADVEGGLHLRRQPQVCG